MKVIRKITLDYAEITIYDNDIFWVNYIGTNEVTYDKVKEITELRWELMGKKPCLSLSSSTFDFVNVSDEAIKFLNSQERGRTVLAHAYVIKGIPQRIVVKMIESFSNTIIPTKGFNLKKEAIKWLLEIKKESINM